MILRFFGSLLAKYLNTPIKNYFVPAYVSIDALRSTIKPGDILLVEGNVRFSVAIKYLTQSTWSHAALYIGDSANQVSKDGYKCDLLEADLIDGIIAIPLETYSKFHTRICRPINLSEEDREKVINFALSKLGNKYDLKNVIDLIRYLLPTPPVPPRWRRQLIALGSGEPTKAICSTLIAQAFQSIHYPILPDIIKGPQPAQNLKLEKDIYHIRHYSLFTPRDFDISPFFQIIKPRIEVGFEYKKIDWDKN